MGDFRVTSVSAIPPTQKERRFQRRRLMLSIIIGGFLILLAGFIIRVNQRVFATGYITSEQYAEIRPPLVGTVKNIPVQSGTHVKQGDLLLQLDSSEEEAILEEAKSQMQKAEAELTRREAEIAEEKKRLTEDIAIAHLRLSNAVNRLMRSRELLEKKAVSEAALEDDVLKEQLVRMELGALTNRDLSIYDKQIIVLRQELEARHDTAERADVNLRAKEIRAPLTGQVLRYEFGIGELVRPEMVLFEIFGGDRLILKLRIPERHAARIAVGNRYSARLSPYRGLKDISFEGKVEYLRNVIQSEGQQTYRVAFCSFDPKDHKVSPGTTAEARIYCGKTCLWFFLIGLH